MLLCTCKLSQESHFPFLVYQVERFTLSQAIDSYRYVYRLMAWSDNKWFLVSHFWSLIMLAGYQKLWTLSLDNYNISYRWHFGAFHWSSQTYLGLLLKQFTKQYDLPRLFLVDCDFIIVWHAIWSKPSTLAGVICSVLPLHPKLHFTQIYTARKRKDWSVRGCIIAGIYVV